jgi:Tfp pilus assembly protein PilF
MLAVMLGLCGLGLLRWRLPRRLDWRVAVAAVAVFALIMTAATVAGGLDRLVISEAPKSVLYRVQYWQATMAMIGDHPLFGCGPGNFQEYYTGYKLPQASESIADPHNFLLEVWATAGTPAMLVFVLLLALAGFGVLRSAINAPRSARDAAQPATPFATGAMTDAEPDASRWIYLGGIIGVLLAMPCGLVVGYMPDPFLLLVGVPPGVLCCWLLDRWVQRSSLPAHVLAIALGVLLLNLLAAGGIGFPGVAQTVWLLLALLLPPSFCRSWTLKSLGVTSAAATVVLVLLGCCLWTFYHPVLTSPSLITQGMQWQRAGDVARAQEAYQRAASADPYSAEPWLHLAALHHGLAAASGSDAATEAFDSALAETLARNPRSHTLWNQAGNWQLDLFRAHNDRKRLTEAIEAYSVATRLYPNHSRRHAQLAWVHHIAGDPDRAADAATEALRLDALNPHPERKLCKQQVYDPADKLLPAENAEQLMQRLRMRKMGR